MGGAPMADTPVTEYVHACVKMLNEHNTGQRNVSTVEAREGYEAVFELVDMPWTGDEDPEWREGYETAVLDVVEAIAQAWGVELPAADWRAL
jgi:hypothetical protein